MWAAFATFGCDMMDVPHGSDQNDPTVMSYDYLSQLPACTYDRNNQVFYVRSLDQFFFCDGRKLQQIALSIIVDKDGKTLVSTADAPPDQCPTGGVLIQVGFDTNRNGKLDSAEIKSTAKVCNGAEGPQGPEGPPGPRGPAGPDGGSCDLVNNGDGTGTITCSDGRSLTVVLAGAGNHGPVANADEYSVDEDTILSVAAPGVLSNDTDADNDTLTAVIASGPANGSVVLQASGAFVYTPNADFSGTDSFTYTASDGSGGTATGTVTITVNAVNDSPVARPDSFTATEDVTLNISAPGVLANDVDPNGDPLLAVIESGPAHGTVVLNSDGSFAYNPNPNFSGSDAFSYRAKDASLASSPATVTINVAAVNDAPVAIDDTFTITGSSLSVAAPGVLVNDVDVEGDSLTAVIVTAPSHGTVVLQASGAFVYTPNGGFSGTDTFQYKANDGSLVSTSAATVTLVVQPSAP